MKGSFLARGRDELNRIASKLNPDKELVLTKSIVTFQQISPSVHKKQKNGNVNEEEEKDSNIQVLNKISFQKLIFILNLYFNYKSKLRKKTIKFILFRFYCTNLK